jgi:thiol-disulfide isomerase/thioredoxin
MRLLALVSYLGAALAAVLATGTSQGQEASPAKIEAAVVKYDGLADVVLKNKGKVVVVDFWHVYCVPCLQGMPHLAEMQQKYGKDNLVVVTVDIDPSFGRDKLPKIQELVRGKLTKYGSPLLQNLILDEPQEVVEKKLRVTSTPAARVFDRQGHWREFSGEYTPADVEKLVAKLVSAK